MAEHEMIVLTNPVAGRDAEFNHWYDDVHLRDVMAVPGVISARRFQAVLPGDWKYAAIYRLDCDDPSTVMQEITDRWKTERMPTSDAFDDSGFLMILVKPIGDECT
jgi:hypothetical protein